MHLRSESVLETRLAAMLMRDLVPCDLGDGIEVVHDVELVEIELECDLDEGVYSAPYERIEIEIHDEPIVILPLDAPAPGRALPPSGHVHVHVFERTPIWDTLPFSPFEPIEVVRETEVVTVPFPRYSAPYERIELA